MRGRAPLSWVVAVAVVVTTREVSAAEPSQGITSWDNHIITLKIPENFPPSVPLLTLAPLYTRHPPTQGQGADFFPRFPPPSSPPPPGLMRAGGSTLDVLKVPSDKGRKFARRRQRGGSARGSWRGQARSGEILEHRLTLLENPNGAFNPKVYDQDQGTISLRLRRPLNHTDYLKHGELSLVAIIGPIEATPAPPPEKGRGGRRGAGGGGGRREEDQEQREDILVVRIIVTENINCDNPTSQACFLPEGDFIQLRQWENRPLDTLLALPRPSVVCPSLTATYTLNMTGVPEGRSELVTPRDHLEIMPRTPLDREARENTLSFTVTCSLKNERRKVSPHTVEGKLFIIDEDDSPPIRIKRPHVNWHYGDNLEDLDDNLMVVDPDLSVTNNYVITLVGNTYNLVTIESVSKFSTQGHVCNKALDDHDNFTIVAQCTVLTPVIKIEEVSCCGREKPPRQIHFSVVVQDRTLLPPYTSAQVVYNMTLTLPYNNNEYTMVPNSGNVGEISGRYQEGAVTPQHQLLLKEVPPAEVNITVIRPVAKFHRLGQLIHPKVSHFNVSSPLPEFAIFYIPIETPSLGLGVTHNMGILYVDQVTELRSGEVVVWRGNSSVIVTLIVEEAVAPNSTRNSCLSLNRDMDEDFPSCAIHTYQVNCESSCAFSAKEGRCWWRHNIQRGVIQSTHYATCSPDIDTCPNGDCDELEIRDPAICPQDCVDHTWIKGQQITLSKSGRGIAAGMSPCTCNGGGCQCFADSKSPPPLSFDPGTPAVVPKPVSQWECESGCQVGVVVVVLLFIALNVFCFVVCRRRAMRNGKQKGGVISLGTLPSEDRPTMPYNPRDETHDSLIHGIRASPRNDHLTLIPALNLTIDQKWEFPRSRLVIEQTLGEGEFGKVMKAKAQGIASSLGYTTVAVKMLKSNSTPAELADLLSEYTLLKEVSHPNVVKLLGACTSKGGPIYIIIEYCQFGSLRNYLKRSRHAEFENRVGSGPGEANAQDYNITPKDILSFAWQICKGMAYLTNMKLVHRDLAARNVLLASGRVCKISDFGLTRDVYEGDLYFKRSKGRVPVKWMALESLVDHVYTSKSDVWGFGVLLWELVTLGTPPYPGITPERLFSLLKAGYRMERPENCSQELYDVMLQCWAEDPGRRPCFQALTDIFENMIQADVEYLELRSLIVTNRGYFDSIPDPPQQFLDAPPQFQDSPTQQQSQGGQGQGQGQEPGLPSPPPPPPGMLQTRHLGLPRLNLEEVHTPRSQDDEEGQVDSESYLVARTSRPRREESTEPLLGSHTPTPNASTPTTHAHNPTYSPSSESPPHPPLHYSTLATRPDEEDAHTLECNRSEEDSDSGRATGDSGYATEEGRGNGGGGGNNGGSRWRGGEHKVGTKTPHNPSSYSPVLPHDQDDDQDTSEDLEERQELLTEDLLLGHLTPSPEPAHHHHHASAHTTPVIV